jgi:hypothetical protein
VEPIPTWLKEKRQAEAACRKWRGPVITELMAKRALGAVKKRPTAVEERRLKDEILDAIDPIKQGRHKYGTVLSAKQEFKDAFLGGKGDLSIVEGSLGLQVLGRFRNSEFHIWFEPHKGMAHLTDRNALESKMKFAHEFLAFWHWRLGVDGQGNKPFTTLKVACDWWHNFQSENVKSWIKLHRNFDPRLPPPPAPAPKPASDLKGANEGPRVVTREILTPQGVRVLESFTINTPADRRRADGAWDGFLGPSGSSFHRPAQAPAKAGVSKAKTSTPLDSEEPKPKGEGKEEAKPKSPEVTKTQEKATAKAGTSKAKTSTPLNSEEPKLKGEGKEEAEPKSPEVTKPQEKVTAGPSTGKSSLQADDKKLWPIFQMAATRPPAPKKPGMPTPEESKSEAKK